MAQIKLGLKVDQDWQQMVVDQDGRPVRGVKQFETKVDGKGRLVVVLEALLFEGGSVIKNG